jgi:cell division protease FtsH
MVTKYGMSDELGPVFLSDKHEVFLGREFGQQSAYSEETAAKVDAEVKKILERAFAQAKKILSENKDKIIMISEVLMTREKLSGVEFQELFEKGTLTEPEKKTKEEPPVVEPNIIEDQTSEKEEEPPEETPKKGAFDEGYDPN